MSISRTSVSRDGMGSYGTTTCNLPNCGNLARRAVSLGVLDRVNPWIFSTRRAATVRKPDPCRVCRGFGEGDQLGAFFTNVQVRVPVGDTGEFRKHLIQVLRSSISHGFCRRLTCLRIWSIIPEGSRQRAAKLPPYPSPRPVPDRHPARHLEGVAHTVRATGMAEASLGRINPAGRQDCTNPAGQGGRGGRLLPAEPAHGRGSRRPRGGRQRSCSRRTGLALLRPRQWLRHGGSSNSGWSDSPTIGTREVSRWTPRCRSGGGGLIAQPVRAHGPGLHERGRGNR